MTDADDSTAPIIRSPDLKKRTRRYEQVPGFLKPVWHYLFVMAAAPTGFGARSLAELAEALRTDDPTVAAAILAEAEATLAEPLERIDNAERRATSLQGSVAIAASVALTGAGLLLYPSRIVGGGWQAAFATVIGCFVLCLVICGIRALSASSRIFWLPDAGVDRITERAKLTAPEALTHRAAEILRLADVADEIGAVKVGLLSAATSWFRRALRCLVILVLLAAVYGVHRANAGRQNAPKTTTTAPVQGPPRR